MSTSPFVVTHIFVPCRLYIIIAATMTKIRTAARTTESAITADLYLDSACNDSRLLLPTLGLVGGSVGCKRKSFCDIFGVSLGTKC